MAENMLAAFSLDKSRTWDFACAAHLMNRAGFGGTLAEIEHLVHLGPEGAVDFVVDYHARANNLPPMVFGELTSPPAVPAAVPPGARGARGPLAQPNGGRGQIVQGINSLPEEQRRILQNIRQVATNAKMAQMKVWWLDRMIRTSRPLEEKMTLFWHGLFVSSAVTVKNTYHLYLQNDLFRKNAVGNYQDLTLAVSKDAAMLEYLNNDQNKREHPNENYARELMELFTMGIGNYTEQDIKESARSFTGWTHIGENFVFNPREHDTGSKTFLGRTGNFDGADIVQIIFQQSATPKYLATRLLKFFAVDEPSDDIVAALAQVCRSKNFQLAPVLKTLFASQWFYSQDVTRRQIKSPVQLVVGAMRLLGVNVTDPNAIDNALKMMGQELFNSPTVKGWDGGKAWINTSTLFARYNLPAYLVTGKLPVSQARPMDASTRGTFQEFQSNWSPQMDVADAAASTGDAIVDYYTRRLIQDSVAERKRKDLIEFLNGTGDARQHLFDPTGPNAENQLRELVQLVMAMADFQLC